MNVDRYILGLCASVFVVGGMLLVGGAGTAHLLLTGVLLEVVVLSAMPWIVFARRELLAVPRPPESHDWEVATRAVLLMSLLVGPATACVGTLWMIVAQPTDEWGGFAPTMYVLGASCLAFGAGLCLYTAAFVIQLWRDQWHRYLNLLSFFLQAACFVPLFLVAVLVLHR